MQQYANIAEEIRRIFQEAAPGVEVSKRVLPDGIAFVGFFRVDDQAYGCMWAASRELLCNPDVAKHHASDMAIQWAEKYAAIMKTLETPQYIDPLFGYSQTAWHEIPIREISPEAFGFLGD